MNALSRSTFTERKRGLWKQWWWLAIQRFKLHRAKQFFLATLKGKRQCNGSSSDEVWRKRNRISQNRRRKSLQILVPNAWSSIPDVIGIKHLLAGEANGIDTVMGKSAFLPNRLRNPESYTYAKKKPSAGGKEHLRFSNPCAHSKR